MCLARTLALVALCATTALGAFKWNRGQCRIGVNSSSQVGSGTLTIGVSVSVTAPANIGEVMAVCLALQNAQLPPPYSFAAFFYEDENNVANAPAEAAAMVGFPVVGIVGCRTSGMTAALNPLVGGIPQCSHASMSAVLSNKTLYPRFLRVPASDALTAYSMIMLLAQYRVTKIAAIGSDDSYGRAGIANLKLYGSRLSTPIQVVKDVYFNPLLRNPANFTKTLLDLNASGVDTYIAFCVLDVSYPMLEQVRVLHMLHKPKVWIFGSGGSAFVSNSELAKTLPGMLRQWP
eukprot:m51a1_g13267 putative taste receptor type 1 member 3-like (290) ;mRNA; r:450-1713